MTLLLTRLPQAISTLAIHPTSHDETDEASELILAWRSELLGSLTSRLDACGIFAFECSLQLPPALLPVPRPEMEERLEVRA
jgi:hypothetical protein